MTTFIGYIILSVIAGDLIAIIMAYPFRIHSYQNTALYRLVHSGAQLAILKEWYNIYS